MEKFIADYAFDTVILGGGDYPSHPIPLNMLKTAQRVVCCDGAAYNYLRDGGIPWRIVGDCDSILSPHDEQESAWLEQVRPIIRRITEQEDNDQTKAVRYCLDHGLRKLVLVGATGRREDHTIGNISLLIEYMRMGAEVVLCTDYGIFIPCHNKVELKVPIPEDYTHESDQVATRTKSTQISVFNINGKRLKSEGLRYPLYDFDQWWQGTLNEAASSPVVIEADGDFLVYVCFTPS